MTRAELEARPGWEAKKSIVWYKDGAVGMEFYGKQGRPVYYHLVGGAYAVLPFEDEDFVPADEIPTYTVEWLEEIEPEYQRRLDADLSDMFVDAQLRMGVPMEKVRR